MKSMEVKARKELCPYIRDTHQKVKVHSGAYLNQNKCHHNAVHFAKIYEEDSIAMVICIDSEDYCFLHFVNFNNKNELYDNTLGTQSENYKYYFVKYINKEDYCDIRGIFNYTLEEFKKPLKFWTKLLLGKDRVL